MSSTSTDATLGGGITTEVRPVVIPPLLARPVGVGDHGGVTRRIEIDVLARRVSTVSAVAVPVLLVFTVLFVWLNRSAPVDAWWLGSLVVFAGLGGFGLVLVRRVPTNPIGWLMLLGGLAQAVMGAARQWTVFSVVTHPHSLPVPAWACWLGTWPMAISIATFPLVVLVFPDGRLASRRSRAVAWVVVVAAAVGCIAQALVPGPFTDDLPGVNNPLGVHWGFLGPATRISQVVLMVTILPAVGSLVGRMRGSSGELRQQLRWITFTGSLLGVELAAELSPLRVPILDQLEPVFIILFLASITVAVLRYRLWDIDSLISVSVVYGTLTVVLGGVYVAVVAATGRLRGHPIALGPSLLAAAGVAVAFAPLRDRLQRGIERRLYADRSDPYRALTRLGDRLGDPESDDRVLDDVVGAVAASLRVDGVAVVMPDGATAAATGVSNAGAVRLPLVFRSEEVGVLVVSPRPAAPIGRRERQVLDTLCPQVAAVVHAVATSQALQRSREALVSTREEERRRVRRDLHDGLGPALAATQMKVEGARVLLARDPDSADAVLAQLTGELRATISDVRRLVHDLRPPALDELGLTHAVAEQVEAFSGPVIGGEGHLLVELDAPDRLPPLPAAVEVAAYRIVSEALTNVVRHAGAGRCLVTLSVDAEEALSVVVDDDGAGVSVGDRPGLGLRSMRERATELGGSCRLSRSPIGGTRVCARLPIAIAPSGGSVDRVSA